MNLAQAAMLYIRRQAKTWDISDNEQLVEMAGPSCCPSIHIRARISHEQRAAHLRGIQHIAMAFGFPSSAIQSWLNIPLDIQYRVLELIELTERGGVEVTDEMLKGWVKKLKEEK